MKPEEVKVGREYWRVDATTVTVKAVADGGVLYQFKSGGWSGVPLDWFCANYAPIRRVPVLAWTLPPFVAGIARDEGLNDWYAYDVKPEFLNSGNIWKSLSPSCFRIPKKYAPTEDIPASESWFSREELEAARVKGGAA